MIAVEGPDLAGKTTLTTALSRALSVPFVHMNAPGDEGDWANVTAVLAEFDYANALVADRFVLSDFAYRVVWPRKKPNTPEQLRKFLAYMRYTLGVIIQCDVPDMVIATRYASRGDEAEQLNADIIIQVAHKYRRMFDALRAMNRSVPILRYDSSEMTPQEFIAKNYDKLLDATVKQENMPLATIQLDSNLWPDIEKVIEA